MKALVEHVIVDTDEVARDLFSERFPKYGTGNYLNPCCQGIHLKLVNKFDQTKVKLEERLNEWNKRDLEDADEEITVSDETSEAKKLSPTEHLRKQMEETQKGKRKPGRSAVFSAPETALEKEIKSYEAFPGAELGVDKLAWWKKHQDQFPLLAYLTRVVFAVQAASSKSEQVFSAAGNILTPMRSSLDPEKHHQTERVNSDL